jgi:hypothetical protein
MAAAKHRNPHTGSKRKTFVKKKQKASKGPDLKVAMEAKGSAFSSD